VCRRCESTTPPSKVGVRFERNENVLIIELDDARAGLTSESFAVAMNAPNVSIKVSDLVAYDHHWTLESLGEVVLHCLECFGVARAMFASDFPAAGLHASFDDVYDAFKVIASQLSADDQRALFFANAAPLSARRPLILDATLDQRSGAARE
jgi:hypothetical protein